MNTDGIKLTIFNFFRLSKDKQQILLKSLFLMIKIRVMLWILPFPGIQKYFNNIEIIAKDDVDIDYLIWAVKVNSHYVPMTTCLSNALTGYTLLSQHGYPSTVKIGVDKSNGKFEAHAWLEHNNKVVIGELERGYVPLFDFNRK